MRWGQCVREFQSSILVGLPALPTLFLLVSYLWTSVRGVAGQTVVGPSSGTDTISSASFLPSQASRSPGKVSEAV